MNDQERITDPEAIRLVLEQRAAELARPHDEAEGPGERVAMVVVAVGDERYGIGIDSVREITPYEGVTPMPATPPFWLGLVNRRGNLAPVLDLARYLGRRPEGGVPAADAQIVVITGPGATIGLMVDGVQEVRQVRPADIGPSLVEASSDRPHVHAGLTADLLAVLDVDALVADPAIIVQDQVD
jgi:chemotaxis signal transduction protein